MSPAEAVGLDAEGDDVLSASPPSRASSDARLSSAPLLSLPLNSLSAISEESAAEGRVERDAIAPSERPTTLALSAAASLGKAGQTSVRLANPREENQSIGKSQGILSAKREAPPAGRASSSSGRDSDGEDFSAAKAFSEGLKEKRPKSNSRLHPSLQAKIPLAVPEDKLLLGFPPPAGRWNRQGPKDAPPRS